MDNEQLDWKNLDKDKALFIFEQAREYLDKVLYASDQLDRKAFIILGFSVTFLAGVIGYIFTQWTRIGLLTLPLTIYALMLFIVCVILRGVINPTKYNASGNLPDAFLKNTILKQKIDYIIAGELKNYSKRCEENNAKNSEKRKNIYLALSILIYTPVILAVACSFVFCMGFKSQSPFSIVGGEEISSGSEPCSFGWSSDIKLMHGSKRDFITRYQR